MRIALAHKRLNLSGGTERVLYRTAEGLRDMGYEVHIFCGEFTVPVPTGTFGHRLPYVAWPRTARLLSFSLLAPWAISRHRCDVVMSFDRMVSQDIFRSGGGPHRVFIRKMGQTGTVWQRLWYRISTYHRCLLAIEKRQMSRRGSKKIIAVCQEGRQEIINTYGVPEERVGVLYNGVDLERFHPRRREEVRLPVRERFGIAADTPVVLFVGTGFRRKGLDRLLVLWKSEKFKDICLLVVGNDNRLSHYRRRWARKEIIFVGPQLTVEDYYGAADLLVLPSIQESFGNVALEAMASGVPVITVPGVGAVEHVDEYLRQGLLTHPEDRGELESKILQFLNRDRWDDLSRSARQVAEKYTWEKYFAGLDRIINQVAK